MHQYSPDSRRFYFVRRGKGISAERLLSRQWAILVACAERSATVIQRMICMVRCVICNLLYYIAYSAGFQAGFFHLPAYFGKRERIEEK